MSKKSQEIKSQLEKVGDKLSFSELNKIKEKLNISGGIRPIAKDLGIETFSEGKTQIPQPGSSSGDEGMYTANFKYQAAENLINAQGICIELMRRNLLTLDYSGIFSTYI